jgi:hypothetical protein
MNCKASGRKLLWPNLRYAPGIFLEGLRSITKISEYPSRDLNPGPHEYEAGVLTTQQQRFGSLVVCL